MVIVVEFPLKSMNSEHKLTAKQLLGQILSLSETFEMPLDWVELLETWLDLV